MGRVQLAFLWHFHQPCYRDLPSGKMLMPWVRLHGTKDYTGMVALLEEFPKIRCTANFSPVLLDQLDAYLHGSTDTMLDLTLVPAAVLTDEQKTAIRASFFHAHPESVIGAHPRYVELLHAVRAGKMLKEADYLDLQVLANLGWFHPLVRSVDYLRVRGRGYAEADKQALVERTLETLGSLLPRWRGLGERVELCVSPYYHPIVPLLCEFASAREAIPDLPLPQAPSFRDEAEIQVRRALEAGEEHFGRRPRGMWPSEGSVSSEACALFARCGAQWVATDEDILGEPGVRDFGGLTVAFRDRELSNLVSFTYKGMPPGEAAADFIRRLEGREGPVPVILDGENPWEQYPDGGIAFLRALYGALSDHPEIETVTMSELVPTGRIDRVFAGSWINRSFSVWIGHEEDRRAWELLGRARADLEGCPSALAWECLRAAEGSDWYWWFGEDFSSAQDMEFDALFRRHLMNAYRAAGRAGPEDLLRPIKRPRREALFQAPRAPLRVTLDGRRTDYFEWAQAGRYEMAREYGAMSGESAFLRDVYYGYDAARLYIRLDFRAGVDGRATLAEGGLRVVVTRPRHAVAELRGTIDEIFEAGVPFATLDVAGGDDVEFFLEFERPGSVPVRIPTISPLWFRAPSPDLEKADWQA
jgi:alpha-amylase/alpha-mannosidase (GH57 family)